MTLILTVDAPVTVITLVMLGLVALLPAATRLISVYSPFPTSRLLYAGLVMAIGLVMSLLWGYAALVAKIVTSEVRAGLRWFFLLLIIFTPPFFLLLTMAIPNPGPGVNPVCLSLLFLIGWRLRLWTVRRLGAGHVGRGPEPAPRGTRLGGARLTRTGRGGLAPPPTRLMEGRSPSSPLLKVMARPMHDIKAIRDNPAAYDRAWASRGLSAQTPALLELDATLRAAQTALQEAQGRRNDASKQIGHAKARKDEAAAGALMAEVEALKGVITAESEIERSAGDSLRRPAWPPCPVVHR